MATFAFVHGACHRGSCWHDVGAALAAEGHTVVAPDLPSDDPDADIDHYARTVIEAIDRTAGADGQDVIVVGHSLAGLTIPVIASRRPVDRLVYLAAIIGQPGKALSDLADIDAERDMPLGDDGVVMFDNGTFMFSETAARTLLYHDCAPETCRAAIADLRPQRSLWTSPVPIDDWPDVPVTSVVCSGDLIVNPVWSERIARERLGVDPVVIDGGHSPMLARPTELAALLAGLA